MKSIIVAMIAVCALVVGAAPGAAQQTTGNIQGRVVDESNARLMAESRILHRRMVRASRPLSPK